MILATTSTDNTILLGYVVIPLLVIFMTSGLTVLFRLLAVTRETAAMADTVKNTNEILHELAGEVHSYIVRTDMRLQTHGERVAVLEERTGRLVERVDQHHVILTDLVKKDP